MSAEPRTLSQQLEIAVIGMSCRFPGARDVAEFWRSLRDGVESISFFSAEELIASGVDPADLRNPNYVKAGGVVDSIELFDPAFFGITPRAAQVLDPQQRLFLECCWEAMESAGYDPGLFDGSIGVFAGQSLSSYLDHLRSNPQLIKLLGERIILMSNDKDHLTTRVSYRLNLKGPAVTIQTTCSTSLVAVHMACQSLLNGECEMAIAGGASLRVPQRVGYLFGDGVSSKSGHCRAFDARADGSVPSGGVGAVLLKPMRAALDDGDCILAVIKGSAINNDGSNKVGYTAPSVDGQAAVISEALAIAQVSPETISYVETHGTGTPLGDPIEIAALTEVYREYTAQKGYCAIGSVKTNIGHADAAAGIAGFIKAALALMNKQIPPSLNFEQPNPEIDFESSSFYVNTVLSDWARGQTLRRAAVSSFGIGGTNAHVILEEAPEPEPGSASAPWQLLPLSAASHSALVARSSQLASWLEGNRSAEVADVAYTLTVGRRRRSHCGFVVCRGGEDAITRLRDPGGIQVAKGVSEGAQRPIAFMFPGGSAQHTQMARELYEWEPVFRREIDRCASLLEPEMGCDPRDYLYSSKERRTRKGGALTAPLQALPALFATEFALAQLWSEWGIRPQAMIGHSMGEYVAACLAGVLDLGDALRLIAFRGRLLQGLPAGQMLSVQLPAHEVAGLLTKGLSIAAVNAPSTTVVSGPVEAVRRFEQAVAVRNVQVKRLSIDVAAHSSVVESIMDEFAAFVATLSLRPPQMPYVSNLTGTWIRTEEAQDPQYWVRHLRHTVKFADGIGLLLQEPGRILLEVGPGRILASLAIRHPARSHGHLTLSSLPHPKEDASDLESLYTTLGRLWAEGVEVDWSRFWQGGRRRRLSLPTYPFQREHYWVDAGRPASVDPLSPAEGTKHALGRSAHAAELETVPRLLHIRDASEPKAAGAPPGDSSTRLREVIEAQLEVIRWQLDLLSGETG